MDQAEITSITEKCFNGEPASCSYACPFGLDVRSLMEKAAKGKWAAAYKTLRSAVVFPGIVSRLCPADCRGECGRVRLGDEAIDLPFIERAIVRYSKKKTAESYAIPPKEQNLAVVGAGVSGLACALDLAKKKYSVTVFDKNEAWGGVLRGYPDFGGFDEDLSIQFGAADITWVFNNQITSMEELSGFDAAYLATGEGGDDFGLLGGYDGLNYATESKGVFLGGGIAGANLAEAIVAGTNAARHIEAYLQTGRTDSVTPASMTREKKNCSRHISVESYPKAPRVVASSGAGYSEDEAMLEASRCMLCDCKACLDSCEMLGAFHKKPGKIAMEVFTDSKVTPPYSTHTITRETYSCNVCSHCESVCPEGINMGELFMRSRRDRYASGAAPYAMHDFWLREMEFHANAASIHAAPRGAQDGKCQYVFYPGCRLGAFEPEHVLKTYGILSSKLDCGIYTGCCGAPAFWAGASERFDKNIETIREASERLGNPIFIFACATCETMFGEHLPEMERISLYRLLAEFADAEPADAEPAYAEPADRFREAAIFDPCSARGDAEMMDSVRILAKKSGITAEELLERNRCCGYGGLAQGGNPDLFERMSQNRADMSDKPYIVYCSNCRDVLMRRGKECAHILDAVLGLPARADAPDISARRQNSIHVRDAISRELKNEMYVSEPHEWDGIKLAINDALADEIDRKLISADDMKEAIWYAETSGDKFVDETDGSVSACLVRNLLTYWVRYKPAQNGEFVILDAYYHRMRFEAESR